MSPHLELCRIVSNLAINLVSDRKYPRDTGSINSDLLTFLAGSQIVATQTFCPVGSSIWKENQPCTQSSRLSHPLHHETSATKATRFAELQLSHENYLSTELTYDARLHSTVETLEDGTHSSTTSRANRDLSQSKRVGQSCISHAVLETFW